MATPYRHSQAHATWRERHDLWWLGLLAMVASALIVVAAGLTVLAWFLSLAQYIPS